MARRSFIGTLRLALLVAVLAFVALGAWLDRRRSTDWDAPLRVTVYPIPAADGGDARSHVAALTAADFASVETFFAEEAARYGLALGEPVRIRVSHAAGSRPPQPPASAGVLGVAAWSLRFRYWAWRVAVDDPLPTPDVQVFALYHPAGSGRALPDSVGLSKGLMALAHLYADPAARGTNQLVVAHALLHTLGASDKYDRATGLPFATEGLGDPDRTPRYPQEFGEIMAGRVATGPAEAVIPDSLEAMLVGAATAREIGWTK